MGIKVGLVSTLCATGLRAGRPPKPVAIARCCGLLVVAHRAEARSDQAQRLCLTVPETSADQLVMRLAVWLGLCAFTRSLTALISSSLWLR